MTTDYSADNEAPATTFTLSASGVSETCSVCGRTGLAGRHTWKTACERGHAPCPDCGRWMSLRHDRQPRLHSYCRRARR